MSGPKEQPPAGPTVSQPVSQLKKKVPSDAAAQMAPILKTWAVPGGDDLLAFSQAAQRSLDAVTHLTEYEDDKANRILTAMAFMSAFAAVIFAVVPSRYPLSMPLILLRAGAQADAFFLLAVYGSFIAFALTLTIGVAFVLHAVRPRFNVPKAWKPDGTKPASLLFFEKIVEVSPADWANAFVGAQKSDLLATQVKNSVLETYLIAEKIEAKMRWLSIGVKLFFASTIILAFLLPLVAATFVLVPENAEPQRQSTQQGPSRRDATRSQVSPKQDSQLEPDAPVNPAPSGKAP
jgi:hypothetical protein